MDISFVILTWNSINHINMCIKSYSVALANEQLHAQFLIVDNGSADNTVNEIENKIFPDLPSCCEGKLFKLNKNFGTTISRNIALRKATGKYIVVCDSDTEYQSGLWKEAIDYLENNSGVGILAPCLRYPDGIIQNSVKKFPTVTDKLIKLGKIFFGYNIGKNDFYSDFPWVRNKSSEFYHSRVGKNVDPISKIDDFADKVQIKMREHWFEEVSFFKSIIDNCMV